ncbi:MAG TPA: PqqD family protein [Candidatus Hydrogenedentes bacterium]|nr:PqqD family protein [Candidatus Hydrogenedentota bacterium]HPG65456.1 PqqD family protein [Candidatus Hydrogenedentota bacterium]
MLESVPQPNPAVRWEDLDTGRILVSYRRSPGRLGAMIYRVFAVAEWSQVLLDDIGSQVVRQMDGRRTVADLIAFVASDLKLSRKEAEVAVLKYLAMLGKRRLIGLEVSRDMERQP